MIVAAIYIDVVDPAGLGHRLLLEGDSIYGAENLAHPHPEGQRRAFLIALLSRIRSARNGDYQGYSWRPVVEQV